MGNLQAIGELLWMLVTGPRTGPLIALLILAAACDWRTSRIPNWLTVSGMALGLVISTTHGATLVSGLGHGAGGLAVGLALLLPLYVMRILGAGDVKMMAMAGAFLGPLVTLQAVLWSFIAGGVLAIGWAVASGMLRQLVSNVFFIAACLLHPGGAGWRAASPTALPSVGKLPLGLGICIGTLACMVARQFA